MFLPNFVFFCFILLLFCKEEDCSTSTLKFNFNHNKRNDLFALITHKNCKIVIYCFHKRKRIINKTDFSSEKELKKTMKYTIYMIHENNSFHTFRLAEIEMCFDLGKSKLFFHINRRF
jgi:Leu/Phe-tRNA-protein transferase